MPLPQHALAPESQAGGNSTSLAADTASTSTTDPRMADCDISGAATYHPCRGLTRLHASISRQLLDYARHKDAPDTLGAPAIGGRHLPHGHGVLWGYAPIAAIAPSDLSSDVSLIPTGTVKFGVALPVGARYGVTLWQNVRLSFTGRLKPQQFLNYAQHQGAPDTLGAPAGVGRHLPQDHGVVWGVMLP